MRNNELSVTTPPGLMLAVKYRNALIEHKKEILTIVYREALLKIARIFDMAPMDTWSHIPSGLTEDFAAAALAIQGAIANPWEEMEEVNVSDGCA